MRSVSFRGLVPLVAAALTWAVLAPEPVGGQQAAPANAAAVRKALDQNVTVDYSTQSFDDAIEHLRQKTKVKIVIDTFMLQQMGINVAFPGGGVIGAPGIIAPGFPGAPVPGGLPGGGQIILKSDNAKLRVALQNFLSQYNLTFVILGDSVLITTEEAGYQRQMRQRVNVDVKDQPLADVLKKLSDETGANLLIDPRQAEKAKGKITLQLDDVTLETAFRLLTAVADLSTVRVGNVLFLTDDGRAEKLRKENRTNENGNVPFPLPALGRGFVGAATGVAQPGIAVPDREIPPPPPLVDPPAKK